MRSLRDFGIFSHNFPESYICIYNIGGTFRTSLVYLIHNFNIVCNKKSKVNFLAPFTNSKKGLEEFTSLFSNTLHNEKCSTIAYAFRTELRYQLNHVIILAVICLNC